MSHIADFYDLGSGYVAVGWLHPDHPFPRGKTKPEVINRIAQFARLWPQSVRMLGGGASGGFHTCEFCGNCGGCGYFAVPDGSRMFYAPDMIGHYVQEHGYSPPPEFAAAIMTCPLPDTADYAVAIACFKAAFEHRA